MNFEEVFLFFINKFNNLDSLISFLGYVFIIGFLVFIIFYFKNLEYYLESWKKMDAFYLSRATRPKDRNG